MTDSALSWVLGDGCKTLRTPAEVRGRWSWVYDKLGGHEDGHGGVHLPILGSPCTSSAHARATPKLGPAR